MNNQINDDNKQKLIKAGCELAREVGTMNLVLKDVCARAGIPSGSFQNYTSMSFQDFVKQVSLESGAPLTVDGARNRRTSHPHLRRQDILLQALKISREIGYSNITLLQAAEKSGVPRSSVSYYFGNVGGLKTSVMAKAVEIRDVKIIAQGLVDEHVLAMDAPQELRQLAASQLIK